MADTRVRVVWEFETKHQHAQITCRTCRRVVIYPPAMAKERFGPGCIDQIEKRLRCEGCGARNASLTGVYREIR